MKTANTFSILFWIITPRFNDQKSDLFVRITVDGKRANIGLKRKIFPDQWDSSMKKVLGNSKEARQINHLINQTQSKLYDIYQELKYKEKLVTAKLVKAKFFGEDEDSKHSRKLLSITAEKSKIPYQKVLLEILELPKITSIDF